MTYRELILLILSSGLENEEVPSEEIHIYTMSIEEAAVKFEVGTDTVRAWINEGMINYMKAEDGTVWFSRNAEPKKGGYTCVKKD